ncbi:MAG: AbrB/MazE/SpoVT family DNA-binding domain-containing protein [Candidatus Eremiobacteraeota bacterium]|nr:AbrB/MazE/SpoVT family DNA-binding domain-containing protein [Candidatus Eremiobacteraeota bacterium]
MRASLQRVGNSQGVIIPKPILAQLGFERDLEMAIEGDALVIRKAKRHPREGWAEAARALAAAGDDGLVWPEFGNDDDDELVW